jgi:TRAP-type C4-dicarboxylate transport system permease small subunit
MRVSLSTKLLIIALCLVMFFFIFFIFALSHPLATSPLPPIVMKTIVYGAFWIGITLTIVSVSMKVINKINGKNKRLNQ